MDAVRLERRIIDAPQDQRFALGPTARTELPGSLRELNHRRYAEEVASALREEKPTRGRRQPTSDAPAVLSHRRPSTGEPMQQVRRRKVQSVRVPATGRQP